MENRQNQAATLAELTGKLGRLYATRALEAQKNFLDHMQRAARDPALARIGALLGGPPKGPQDPPLFERRSGTSKPA